jgi:hypothetical protein
MLYFSVLPEPNRVTVDTPLAWRAGRVAGSADNPER